MNLNTKRKDFKEIARKEFETLKKFFECSICGEDFISPTQTPCGHVFCSNCIKTVCRAKSASCPLCKSKITRRGLRPREDVIEMSKAVCSLICSLDEPEESPEDEKEENSSKKMKVDDDDDDGKEEEEELLSLSPTPSIQIPSNVDDVVKKMDVDDVEEKAVKKAAQVEVKGGKVELVEEKAVKTGAKVEDGKEKQPAKKVAKVKGGGGRGKKKQPAKKVAKDKDDNNKTVNEEKPLEVKVNEEKCPEPEPVQPSAQNAVAVASSDANLQSATSDTKLKLYSPHQRDNKRDESPPPPMVPSPTAKPVVPVDVNTAKESNGKMDAAANNKNMILWSEQSQVSQVSASEDEDEVLTPVSSPTPKALDLSIDLPSPVADANRIRTPRVTMNYVHPLDFSMKKERLAESPSIFRSPFPTNKVYLEPRSKPTDVVSPIRKRRRTSRLEARSYSPERTSPYKQNLMRRFDVREPMNFDQDISIMNLNPNPSESNMREGIPENDIKDKEASLGTNTTNDKVVTGQNVDELPPTVQALICSAPVMLPKPDSHLICSTPNSNQMLANLFRSPSVESGRVDKRSGEVSERRIITRLTPSPERAFQRAEASASLSMFRDSEFPAVIPDETAEAYEVDDYDSMIYFGPDDDDIIFNEKPGNEVKETSDIVQTSQHDEIKPPTNAVCDSDVVCVDEVRSTRANDDTCYSEPIGDMENGGVPGCTGVDLNELDSDSDSESSFLAPTPPRPTERTDGHMDRRSQSMVENQKEGSHTDFGSDRNDGEKDIFSSSILDNPFVSQNEENFIATDSFENVVKSDAALTGVTHDLREETLGDTTSPIKTIFNPVSNINEPVTVINQQSGVINPLSCNLVVNEVRSFASDTDLSATKRKFVFCPTRLSRTQLSKLSSICQKFNGEITKDYTNEVTHLVINLENNRVPQTMKYLFAVADKKWVVIFDWIECCVKEGKMVPEERYETSSFPHCDKGAKKSRITSTQLFAGISFYFATPLKSTGAPIEDCKLLIQKMGGVLVTSLPASDKNLLIIGDSLMTNKTYQDWFTGNGWVAVTWEWILDCLLTYSIVPFAKGHLITQIDPSTWRNACVPSSVMEANHHTFSNL